MFSWHPYSPTMKISILALSLLAFSLHPASAENDPFFFKDGDRAMILGDSITEGRTYSTLVESYVLSRFPQWKITFRNTGWSGDTMGLRTRGGLDKGYDRDLKPFNATAVTIDFGMNDARQGDKGYQPYLNNARALAEKFTGDGARIAFITSSPEERYQEGQPAGSSYNLVLRTYSDGLKSIAAEKNALFVDQLAPMIAVIESGRKSGALSPKEGNPRLIPDAVHPGWAGGLVMATTILKELNAPALVSRVEIDAASGKHNAENATVSDVKTGDILSFTRLDASMPWPLNLETLAMPEIPGFKPFDDLSRYELKVTHLSAPRYEIAIDQKAIGVFTREELASGVNLSAQSIPAMPEVAKLFNAIMAKNALHFQMWRWVQLWQAPDWLPAEAVEGPRAAKIKEMEAELNKADEGLHALRQPQPHQWTLTPVN